MTMKAIIYSFLISILVVLVFYIIFKKNNENNLISNYSDSFGHRYDKNIEKTFKKAKSNLQKGKEKIESNFVAGEIANFNLNRPDIAQEFYQRATEEVLLNNIEDIQLNFELEALFDRYPVREEEARAIIAENREEKFERIVRSDPQNVHDSNVTSEMKKRFDLIKETTNKIPLADLSKVLKKKGAIEVFKRIISDPSRIEMMQATDKQILEKVWARINNKENEERKEELIKSLEDNLDNCYDKGYIVCVTGRASNIIDSLTLLDNNKKISEPIISTDILRKEVMNNASNFIQTLDEKDKEIYEKGEEHPLFQTFSEEIKEKLANNIKINFVNHQGPILDKIIEEAKLAI